MGGTLSPEELTRLVETGLLLASGVYRQGCDGALVYDGVRPDGGWHVHGYFPRHLWSASDGQPLRIRIWKRRWIRADRVGEPLTCHSRPPDDFGSVWFCGVVVFWKLWAYLDASEGIHSYEEPPAIAELGGCRRTVQRWMRRALALAPETLQGIRRAIIERSEPRPVEQLFPRGVPPPERLRRSHWRVPASASTLWQAFAMFVGGVVALEIRPPVLLAEARGRQADPNKFLI